MLSMWQRQLYDKEFCFQHQFVLHSALKIVWKISYEFEARNIPQRKIPAAKSPHPPCCWAARSLPFVCNGVLCLCPCFCVDVMDDEGEEEEQTEEMISQVLDEIGLDFNNKVVPLCGIRWGGHPCAVEAIEASVPVSRREARGREAQVVGI